MQHSALSPKKLTYFIQKKVSQLCKLLLISVLALFGSIVSAGGSCWTYSQISDPIYQSPTPSEVCVKYYDWLKTLTASGMPLKILSTQISESVDAYNVRSGICFWQDNRGLANNYWNYGRVDCSCEDGSLPKHRGCLDSRVISLSTVPQTPPDPRPKGAEGKDGKSTLELIARVTENGNPKAGVTVGFGVGVEGFTGGHANGDLGSIPRPKGKLSKPSDVTDGNGEIKLTFFADEPAGLHAVVADCTPAGCTNKATHVVKVKVPDLIHIPPDTETPPRYTLVGNVGDASNGYKTFQHNITHYLTEQSWSNLKTLISTFIDLGWGQIGINDASLEWGGLFDIEGKWTTSGGHAEHRDGKQVDISFVRPLSVSSDKRQKVFDEVCASKGAALPVVLWHQNDGYAPHFHIYLTGQSVTGAKKQCSKQ